MESKKIFTKAMLQEECGITNVTESYFEKEVHKVRADKDVKMTTYPTLCILKTKDKKRVHYISLTTSLYNYKTGKYVNLPFHKLRWIWQFGEIEMGKVIDHIDTNPLNNDLSNLRLVSEQDNRANKKRWKQFTLEEVKDKSVDELREMIAQRIEEYKDVSYSEIKVQERSEQKAKEREEWLSHSEERKELQLKKKRITTLKKQIKRLEDEILHYRTKDEFHSEDWLNRKVKELSEDIVTKRAELIDLESLIC